MKIDERSVGNVTVLDIAGQITFTKGDMILRDKIHSLIHQGRNKILINLGGVDYVDSAGLGELVGAYTTVARAGGGLKLLNLTKKMRDLMSITKLLTVFDTFDSEPEAVKTFN
jgi:anti-sigma B factor antagonist